VDAAPPQRVIDIDSIELQIPERRTLLSTSALQLLVESLVETTVGTGRLAKGPRIRGPVDFSASFGKLSLPNELVEEGTPKTKSAIISSTFNSSYARIMRFENNKWKPVSIEGTLNAESITFPANSLTEGSYRLVIAAPREAPVIDQKLRPLQPDRFAMNFRLAIGTDGNLHLDTATTNE